MLDNLLLKLFKCQLPSEDDILSLIAMAKESFMKLPNVVGVNSPVVVCGDIHGQFHDLLELFKVTGLPPASKLLFLGDYVDRGFHSLEVITLLVALHLRYPDHVTLLRGNHESRQITQAYGFYDECVKKMSGLTWRAYTELFDTMPISGLIDDKYFCCHGGLSPTFSSIDDLRAINRFREVPHSGPMCDLLWSDPDVCNGWGASPRGAGYTFGPDRTHSFNEVNGTKCILRAHQLMMEGHQYHHDNSCVTIFSAPNYCYRCNNLASVINIENDRKDVLCFDQAEKTEDEAALTDFFY